MKDLSLIISEWMNRKVPVKEDDLVIMQYGIQLIIDNIIKLTFIQILGIILDYGFYTFIILAVFSSLRIQAGGIHAKTSIGCTLSMLGICMISVLSSKMEPITLQMMLVIISTISILIIVYAPVTQNIDLFCKNTVVKKRVRALLCLAIWFIISVKYSVLRNVIICTISLEGLSLIPFDKINVKCVDESRVQ